MITEWTLRRYLRPVCWVVGHGKPLPTEYVLTRVDYIAEPYRLRIALFDESKLDREIAAEKRRRQHWMWCSRCGLKLGKAK